MICGLTVFPHTDTPRRHGDTVPPPKEGTTAPCSVNSRRHPQCFHPADAVRHHLRDVDVVPSPPR